MVFEEPSSIVVNSGKVDGLGSLNGRTTDRTIVRSPPHPYDTSATEQMPAWIQARVERGFATDAALHTFVRGVVVLSGSTLRDNSLVELGQLT